jgi:hypothetical protein
MFWIRGKRIILCVGQRRRIFIGTESTPNPHSMKFVPKDQIVLPEQFGTGIYLEKRQLKEILRSPLAKKIFAIDGIKSTFFGNSFITVTKEVDESWQILKPLMFSAILDFYGEKKPAIEVLNEVSDTTVLDTDSEGIILTHNTIY